MYGYIYLTTNTVNNKKYIGQHRGEFTTEYLGSGKVLKQALSKYGKENFTVIMLDTANSKEELDSLEKKYIEEYNALYEDGFYNIHEGGTGGNTKQGYSFEEYQAHIDKVSKSHKNNKTKVNAKGENNPMYGKHQSEFSKIKRRIAANRVSKSSTTADRQLRDAILGVDKELLKSKYNQVGVSSPRSLTLKITNTDTGEEQVFGSKALLADYLGITIKILNRAIENKYYKPYIIEIIGETKEVSYISTYSIRRLDNIIRYNNRLKNHTQTVASHSYYVTYTMMRLLEEVDLPIDTKYRLLSYCLVHDVSEIHTGDLPHDVKAAYPQLKDIVDECEKDFYIQTGMYNIIKTLDDDFQKIKYNLFKLCDLMDVYMYAKEELYLGNNSLEMSRILTQSIEDCQTIVRALKFYNVLSKDFNFIKFLDSIYEVKLVTVKDKRSYNYTTDEMEDSKLEENK